MLSFTFIIATKKTIASFENKYRSRSYGSAGSVMLDIGALTILESVAISAPLATSADYLYVLGSAGKGEGFSSFLKLQ